MRKEKHDNRCHWFWADFNEAKKKSICKILVEVNAKKSVTLSQKFLRNYFS